MKSKFIFNLLFLFIYLFLRIKQAISKKDEQVQALRVQFEAAVKRADHLEDLLAQQRKLIATTPSNGTSATKKTLPS
jgi:hypothetical protein